MLALSPASRYVVAVWLSVVRSVLAVALGIVVGFACFSLMWLLVLGDPTPASRSSSYAAVVDVCLAVTVYCGCVVGGAKTALAKTKHWRHDNDHGLRAG
jgi:hypothetical protein